MKRNQVFRVLFLITAIILLGIGLYLFTMTSRNLYTAIFLRAGFISLMFFVFWKKVMQLPRWTDIGWLPIVAALIAWKPFLLKFAIPTSVLLMFLMSPFARGKYKPKSWRRVISTVQTVRNARSTVKSAVTKTVVNAVAEVVKEKVAETVKENIQKAAKETETVIATETDKEPLTKTVTENKTETVKKEEKKAEQKTEQSQKKSSGTQSSQSSRNSRSDIRGPQAKNVMFRAMSRVAGRQVGKMMNSGKKGK
ncbi:MAG: hypothetical protein Q4C70_02550 [Planctomycetia bacterium]|nr:hypothetical protein [Planctomycetia bacterium]